MKLIGCARGCTRKWCIIVRILPLRTVPQNVSHTESEFSGCPACTPSRAQEADPRHGLTSQSPPSLRGIMTRSQGFRFSGRCGVMFSTIVESAMKSSFSLDEGTRCKGPFHTTLSQMENIVWFFLRDTNLMIASCCFSCFFVVARKSVPGSTLH